MGSGGSKNNLDAGFDPKNRRPSQHELTNPPTESRGSISKKKFRHWPKVSPQSCSIHSFIDLVPCKICKRSFATDRIEKHKVNIYVSRENF